MDDCPLSRRQAEALSLIADGLEPCQVAVHLGIREHTVRQHLSSAIRRTGQASTLQAVLVSVRRGWIHAPALTPADDVIWRERLERRLLAIEKQLQGLGSHSRPLSTDTRDYLTALDEHLALRHWDEVGIVETRVRMRHLIEKMLTGAHADE
jgi:DNA-binding CsgD family transcriptional regulator